MVKPHGKRRHEETEEGLDPIEHLEQPDINGVRQKIKKLFQRAVVVLGVGTAAGAYVGDTAQDAWREFTGYTPGQPKIVEVQREEGQSAEESREAEEKGWLQKARDMAARATEWSKKEAVSAAENTQLMKDYREAIDFFRKLRELADKGAFWLPFLLAFSAAVLLTNVVIKGKKEMTETVDPAVEAYMKKVAEKMNELVDAENRRCQLEKGSPSPEEQAEGEALADEFERNRRTIT